MFGGHFCSQSLARIPGCQALSKAPAMSSAKRQHFVSSLRARPAKLTTVVVVEGFYYFILFSVSNTIGLTLRTKHRPVSAEQR